MVVERALICSLRVDVLASSSMASGGVGDRELSNVIGGTIVGLGWRVLGREVDVLSVVLMLVSMLMEGTSNAQFFVL